MECPYCAEDIKDNALKCKHCGEWLDKTTNHEILQQQSLPETPSKPVYEKINKIFRQGNIFIDIGETLEQPAHLPEEYYSEEYFKKKGVKHLPEMMEAKTFGHLGHRNVRYSNLFFKGWGIYDMVFTSDRIVIVGANPRKRFDPVPLIGIAGVALPMALEKYQQLTKDKKIDLNIIDDLTENRAAIYSTVELIERIIIAEEKFSFWGRFAQGSSPLSRIIVKGEFVSNNQSQSGFIAFTGEDSKKGIKKMIEKNINIQANLLSVKVDVDSDYRETLKMI
jgi:hypothetical protein